MKKTQSNSLIKKIDLGVRKGVALALAQHKKEGRSIFVSKNGKIVKIPPNKIKIPKEFIKEFRKKKLI